MTDRDVPEDMLPDDLRGQDVPEDMLPDELRDVPEDMLPGELRGEPEPLGPPIAGQGRRFAGPAVRPRAPPGADPYGQYYSQNRPTHAPEGSFAHAFAKRADETFYDPIRRGYTQTAQASNVLTGDTMLESLESSAADIARREREMRAIPKADYMEAAEKRTEEIVEAVMTPEQIQRQYERRQYADDLANGIIPRPYMPMPQMPTEAETAAREMGSAFALRYGFPQPPAAPLSNEYNLPDDPPGMPPVIALSPEQKASATASIIATYLKDPRAAINVSLESLTGSATALGLGFGLGAGGGAVGGPAGAVGGAMLGAGTGSFLTEYGNDVLAQMRDEGLDLTNEQVVANVLRDPAFMARVKEHARKRGAAVGSFDALSAGVGGRVAAPVERAVAKVNKVAGKIAGEGTEILAQGALGGAGEVFGAAANREPVDPAAVAQEVVGEAGSGAAEILSGRYQDAIARPRAESRAREQAAEAAKERALASAFNLSEMIRNPPTPPLTLRPPAEEDAANIQMSWEELMQQLNPGMHARDEREFNTLPPMFTDPNVQPDLFGTMPPPATTGSRDSEAGGVQAAPSPVQPQGTAPRSKIDQGRLSGALRAMAEMSPDERQTFLESLARAGALAKSDVAPLLAQAAEEDKTRQPTEQPLSSAFQQPAAPPATPASQKPAPTPAPHAAPADSTAQKPVGGAAPAGQSPLDKVKANLLPSADEAGRLLEELTDHQRVITHYQQAIAKLIDEKGPEGLVKMGVAPADLLNLTNLANKVASASGGHQDRVNAARTLRQAFEQFGQKHGLTPPASAAKPAQAASPLDKLKAGIQSNIKQSATADQETVDQLDRDTATVNHYMAQFDAFMKEHGAEGLLERGMTVEEIQKVLNLAMDAQQATDYQDQVGKARVMADAFEKLGKKLGFKPPPAAKKPAAAKAAPPPAPAPTPAPAPGPPQWEALNDEYWKRFRAMDITKFPQETRTKILDSADRINEARRNQSKAKTPEETAQADRELLVEVNKGLAVLDEAGVEGKKPPPEDEGGAPPAPKSPLPTPAAPTAEKPAQAATAEDAEKARVKKSWDDYAKLPEARFDSGTSIKPFPMQDGRWNAAWAVDLPDGVGTNRFSLADGIHDETHATREEALAAGGRKLLQHLKTYAHSKADKKKAEKIRAWLKKATLEPPKEAKPAQAAPAREPTGGDQVTPQPYGSGMSRPGDFKAAEASSIGAGVVATELSAPMIDTVAEAVVNGKEVFVDSGAFSAFKAAMKAGKSNATKADFNKVFAKYNQLTEKVKAQTTHMQRGLLTLVAPDVVGDQAASLDLLRKHADEVKQWMEDGFEVIVPFQRGPLPQSEVYKQVTEILGGTDFVVGIPSNAAALSNEDFAELLSQPYKPDRIHILGAVKSPRLEERMKVIRDAYKEEVPGVTTDANLIRSKIDELRGKKGEDRVRAIQQILEESATEGQKQLAGLQEKPAAEAAPAPQAEEKPAAPAAVKPFPLPEVPPIKTKGAKRSRKVEAELEKQRARFQELWAEYKQLGKQWKSDDLPTAIAHANTPVGLGLHYLKSADTFRAYTNGLSFLNQKLEEAISTMRNYKAPAPPTKRTADQDTRAQTLDDLVADQSTLRLRDGMEAARNTVTNPQTVFRSFWKNTFPKLNWRAKEYALELARETTYGGLPQEDDPSDIERAVKSMPKDVHDDAASLWKYVSFMQFADQYLNGKRELPPVRKHKRGEKKGNNYESLVPRGTPIREQAGVEPMEGDIIPLPTTEEKFGEVIDDYAGLFEDPDVKVHATDHPDYTAFMSEKAAKRRVLTWEKRAEAQARKNSRMNADKVIFSLFDLTKAWSQPYIDAGYTVIPLDLQTGDDVLDLSVAYLHERFPDIADAYGILIAAPCTDFTLAGNRHMKAKDESGKTELSKELVFQALRLVDYYKPKMWVIENPAYSYIEDAAGLPKARYEFQPYDFGDPYMKRTQLWGNFNTDLPVAPVYPREGSKMWSQYGGKSQSTKNARSETPKGFAYAFFLANNVADATPHERLIAQFPDAAGAIEKALEAGFTEEQILEVVEPVYENDDAKEARADLRALVKKGTPEGEPQQLPQPEKREQTKRAKFTLAAEREVQAKLKAERDARMGKTEPTAEEAEADETTPEEEDEEVAGQDEDVGEKAAGMTGKGIEAGGVIPTAAEVGEGVDGGRLQRAGELATPPSTPRENLMNFLGLDPFKFRQMGGKEQWDNARRAIMEKYGFSDIFIHEGQNWRNAVDHLLDGFESLQNMAQAMGQGNRIVSLGGKVSLYMRAKTKGSTKAYFAFRASKQAPADNTIALHDQADFYSHELAHALDYDLMERVGGMEDGGLSRMIRNRENAVGLPGTTLEAFIDLMTAMYYDAPHIAIEIKKAEHQLEKTKSAKQRAALQKRLDNLKSGAWRGRAAKTQFYQRAKDGPLKDYMTKPTELLARTFEAYISWKIQSQHAIGLVKFVGATDAIYSDEADAWIKRAYPHGQDRMNIFSRWDALLGQLAREDLYNVKEHPPGYANSEMNLGLLDPVAQARAMGITITPEIVQAHNLSVAAAKEFIQGESKRQDTFRRNLKQLMKDFKDGSPQARDTMRAAMRQIADTPDQIFKYLERRFPKVPILRTIRNNLSDAHISGRNKPVGVYREIQREENSFVNWVEEQLADVGIGRNMPAAWTSHFWDVIHGFAEPRDATVRKQADRWRYVQEYLWKRRDRAGENIGYVDEPYARRTFLTLVADNPQFHADIEKLRQAEKEALIETLSNQIAKLEQGSPEEQALQRKLKEANEIDVEERTTHQIAAMKGLKWGAPVYLGAISEDSAKERVFGPLADKMLKDWYMKDPFWLLAGYAGAAARGEVMSRRFNNEQDKVFESWLRASARGLPTAFAGILREAMEVSMGFRKNPHTPLARAINAYATVSTAAALGRSALPSISEPLNILSKSFHSLRDLGQLFKAMVPFMQSQHQKERYAIADRFGEVSGTLVEAASSMTALAQNLGEDVQGNGLLARFSMRAYWFNLVATITAWQERVVNRVGFELLYEAARMVRKGGEDAGMYRQWLREHGIRDADAFADYLKDARQVGMITFEDLMVPRNRELANAIDHLVHTTIQKPTPSTKHIQAHNGAIGVMLRLTSWITTNATNWRDALIDRTKSAITGQYGSETLTTRQRWEAMAWPVAMSLMTMYVAQSFFVVMRMALTHGDEWEDRGEDFWDRFFSFKTQAQVIQYWGVLGWGMNTLTDIVAGARFNRGVYATVAGQVYGGLAQDLERILTVSLETYDELTTGKPEGKNTAEYNALQAVAHQGGMLSLLALLSVLPTQPWYTRLLGGLWTFWGTSPQAQREFAEVFVGEKDSALEKKAAAGGLESLEAKKEVKKREMEDKLDPDRRKYEMEQKLEKRK